MLNKLNPQQKQAVDYLASPLLVLAGAGSGKTGVITRKIAWLIEGIKIKPSKIVAVTFTNKAAREMKARVSKILSRKQTRGLTVSTFHSLGLNIISKEFISLGYRKNFSIYDTQDCKELLLEINNIFTQEQLNILIGQISKWKGNLISPIESLDLSTENLVEANKDLTKTKKRIVEAETDKDLEKINLEIESITISIKFLKKIPLYYKEYQTLLKKRDVIDFDDLISLPVLLFRKNSEALKRWQDKIHYLLVDEYQDTNVSQYELVKLLVGERNILTVVGDDDQSIYAWRGAKSENINLLNNDYPNLKVIKLEQNYRSSGRILKAANQLISNNPHLHEKNLWSKKIMVMNCLFYILMMNLMKLKRLLKS
jgi:ATP-dependent DNA helicase Rep